MQFNDMNLQMKNLMVKLNKRATKNIILNSNLLIEYIGCDIILYRDLYINDFFNNFKKIIDRSLNNNEYSEDIEDSLNRIFISDIINKKKRKTSKIHLLKISLFVANLIYNKFKACFSDECFIIIVSINLNGKFIDSKVTFHKVRGNEMYLNHSFLEEFKEEAIGYLLTNELSQKFIL